jgi:hypothetical protein
MAAGRQRVQHHVGASHLALIRTVPPLSRINASWVDTGMHHWSCHIDVHCTCGLLQLLAKIKQYTSATMRIADPYSLLIILTPNTPSAPEINEPANGHTGTSYHYTFTSTSPIGRNVYYYITWRDTGEN